MKSQMKGILKPTRTMAMLLCSALVLSSFPSAAATTAPQSGNKDETIYFQLDAEGKLTQTSVVNAIAPVNGLVEDFGPYTTLKNLSDAHVMKQDGDRIFVELPATYDGLFYYEGQLDSAVSPWLIQVDYLLDKKAITPAALAGKSGHLIMKVSVKPNPDAENGKVYTERFTLSVTAALSTDRAENIKAPGATIVTAAGDKQINMTVLPKQEKTFVVEADVNAFEMTGMTVNAVEAAIGLDIDTGEATEGFEALSNGAGELVKGTKKLKTATSDLSAAGTKLSSGFDTLVLNWNQLLAGIKQFGMGLTQVSTEGEKLAGAMTQLDQQLKAGQSQVSSPELKQLATQLAASQDPAVKQLATASLGQMTLIDQTQQGISQLSTGVSTYTGGVKKIEGEFVKVSGGLTAFGGGLTEIQKALSAFAAGLKRLPSEVGQLVTGQQELHKGIETAQTELEGIMEDLPDLSGDDKAALPSFVSNKNTPSSVQFLMRTAAIELPEAEEPEKEDEVKLTFWERLMKLFGL